MKHIFYINLDLKHRNKLTFLKKTHEADERGMLKSCDRFATQNLKINKLFDNKCHNFKEPGEPLPDKTQT